MIIFLLLSMLIPGVGSDNIDIEENPRKTKSKMSNRGSDKKKENNEHQFSSPRGVLEIPVSSPLSDSPLSENGGNMSSKSKRNSFFNESPPSSLALDISEANKPNLWDNVIWKNFCDQVKKKSSGKKFPVIPFLTGGMRDVSRMRKLRLKLGRNWSAEDTIDINYNTDFVMTKPSWRNFTYKELQDATDDFTEDNLVGEGGHAKVYKGRLSDGEIVAVKKITKSEKNEGDRVADFLSELGIIAHVTHPNAAKLVGFSIENGLHLVLQYIQNGSLAVVLHDKSKVLDWDTRYKVAVGVAEGIQYLHCDCVKRIIHRDITASNILMTEDYEPQISDFGLAKWLPENWDHHVVSPIEGTFGYMAPEYFMHGIVHEKTDVFAFGVLLLELITGRHAVDTSMQSLAIWAKPLLEKSSVSELVDPRLEGRYDPVEIKRAMFTASVCLYHLPKMRPNMKKVVDYLKGVKEPVEMRLKSMGGKGLMVEACDLEGYTSTTYQDELDQHMKLIME